MKITRHKRNEIMNVCRKLISAHKNRLLSSYPLPEDNCPNFGRTNEDLERKLFYFTLPMCMNYRRNSVQLWKATLETFNDPTTSEIFSISYSSKILISDLKEKLLKYRMAMQPVRHADNWYRISNTIYNNWGSISEMLEAVDYDFLKLKQTVQREFKSEFPYLSGPKLFNYWSYILTTKCDVPLHHKDMIDIAVDTHVIQSSIKLGIISQSEGENSNREDIAKVWSSFLKGSDIAPVELNVPFWFWSRDGFTFKV